MQVVNHTRDDESMAAIVGAAVGARHGRHALPQRWVRRSLGRTRSEDDGRVQELVEHAVDVFASTAVDPSLYA